MTSWWPYSTLPGPSIPRPRPVDEPCVHGGRRGLSAVTVVHGSELFELEIAHFATKVEDWKDVDDQRLWVWAREIAGGSAVSGVQFSHPCDPDLGYEIHANVWNADEVFTKREFRGSGIASALYAHAYLFGYKITASWEPIAGRDDDVEGCHGGGDGLWKRLHPGYELAEHLEELPCVRATRDSTQLAALVARFGPTAAGAANTLLDPLQISTWGLPGYSSASK
jgi:GNAT superfamily N-acetyltransferase